VARVSVGADGKVSEVAILGGSAILVGVVKDVVKKWAFVTGAERTFELTCDFVISEESLVTRRRYSFVVEPFHLRVVANPPTIETNVAGTRKH